MKKTIYLILVAFLILLGCSKVDDVAVVNQGENQLKSAPTIVDRTVPMYYQESYPNTPQGKLTVIPVECGGGVPIDYLQGTLDVFCRMYGHYASDPKDPTKQIFVSEWMIHSYSGTLTSTSGSGEVFDVHGTKKMDVIGKVFTFHLNIKGSLGNHYILTASGTNANNSLGYTFTIERAVCPGNGDGE